MVLREIRPSAIAPVGGSARTRRSNRVPASPTIRGEPFGVTKFREGLGAVPVRRVLSSSVFGLQGAKSRLLAITRRRPVPLPIGFLWAAERGRRVGRVLVRLTPCAILYAGEQPASLWKVKEFHPQFSNDGEAVAETDQE